MAAVVVVEEEEEVEQVFLGLTGVESSFANRSQLLLRNPLKSHNR